MKVIKVSIMFILCISITVFSKGKYHHNNKKDIKYSDKVSPITSKTLEGNLNSQIIFLADQLENNINKKYKKYPVVITTFVNLDNLTKTGQLGRLIAESLQHELQVRKWKVIDIRVTKNIYVNENGEFILSRNINKLKNTKGFNVGGILTGTYSFVRDSVIVNAKIIDLSNGLIVSSGQIILPINIFNSELYEGGTVSISISGD